jgi:hypothetical protein
MFMEREVRTPLMLNQYEHFLPSRARHTIPPDYFATVLKQLTPVAEPIEEYLQKRERADREAAHLRAEDLEQRYTSRAR